MQNISDHHILSLLEQPPTFDQGFRLLMRTYQERIYSHIRRMVIEHEDASDLTQNCFIKVYRNMDQFERKSQLYTWLYRIATNEAITFLNKKKRQVTTSMDAAQGHWVNHLSADSYFDGDAAQHKLQQALLTLPEKQRLVFNMRYFDDLSYQDISDILGTSVGGLKASYHHAVKKVEAFLKDEI